MIMRVVITAISLVGIIVLSAGCATDYPQPPSSGDVEAYREWKEKKENDEFFGRTRGPKVGPFTFGKKARRHPINQEDNW
jgi:hypothetical protein